MGMSWVFLALVSATCKAGHQVLQKRLIEKVGVLELSLIGQLVAALMIFPLALVPNSVTIPEDAAFHAAAWISIVLNVVAILLLLEAIRVGELSYALPFLALTPLFCIATGWILRGEQVTLAGTVGILVLLGGAFALGANSLRDFVRLGGHRVFHDKGVRLVILVAAIYAVSSVYDKTATVLSRPTFLCLVFARLARRVAGIFVCCPKKTHGDIGSSERFDRQSRHHIFRTRGAVHVRSAFSDVCAANWNGLRFGD